MKEHRTCPAKGAPFTPFHSQVTQPEGGHLEARACLMGPHGRPKGHVFCGFPQGMLRPWDALTIKARWGVEKVQGWVGDDAQHLLLL